MLISKVIKGLKLDLTIIFPPGLHNFGPDPNLFLTDRHSLIMAGAVALSLSPYVHSLPLKPHEN